LLPQNEKKEDDNIEVNENHQFLLKQLQNPSQLLYLSIANQ